MKEKFQCPVNGCTKTFESKDPLSIHALNCLESSILSENYEICLIDPTHLVKKSNIIEHFSICNQQNKASLSHSQNRKEKIKMPVFETSSINENFNHRPKQKAKQINESLFESINPKKYSSNQRQRKMEV